jgi:hypothetical protein
MKITKAVLDATKRNAPMQTMRLLPTRAMQLVETDAVDEPRDADPLPPLPQSPRVVPPALPGDVLLAALDAATGRAQRDAIMAAASVEARAQMQATLAYQHFSKRENRNPAFAAVLWALDSAPDSAARAAVTACLPPALATELAEHLWLRAHRDIEGLYLSLVQ